MKSDRQNNLPSGLQDLFALAGRMEAGLHRHARWLPFFADDPERFTEKFAAARTAETDYATARSRQAAAAARLASADAAQTAWLAQARLVLMLGKGAAWSEAWIETGFAHRATHVPKRLSARTALCGRVAAFFARTPQWEVAFARVTAEAGDAVHREMLAAEEAVRTARADAREQKRVRDVAERVLRQTMSWVRRMLGVMFTTEDARWANFGLHQPASGRSARQPRQTFARPLAEIVTMPTLAEANAAEVLPQAVVA